MSFLDRFQSATAGLDALSVGVYPHIPCSQCMGKQAGEDDEECDECSGRGTECPCGECSDLDPETGDEGGFSWSDCDTCNSSLGGNRYPAHALLPGPNREVVHLEVCTDCLVFIANGDLPDEEQ